MINKMAEKKTKSGKKTSDDNLMAAIAHASAIIVPVIVPLIIWLIQKDKSKYVEFQAKQALVYQIVVSVGLSVLGMITGVLAIVVIGIFLIPVLILLWLGAILYALYGAYECFSGRDFRYAWIADQLAE